MFISNRPTKSQIHAFASDSLLAIPVNIVSAAAAMAAHLPLSCPTGVTYSGSKLPSYSELIPLPRQSDRKSSSLPPPSLSRQAKGADRRSSLPYPRRPASTLSSLTPSTTATTSPSRSSSTASLSRSAFSRSSSSTQIPGLASIPESYILATPPPRPGYSQTHLIFQIQRLTSRRVLPVFNVKRPVTSPAPVAAFQKKVILPKKLSAAQFVVYSCDDIEHDTHTSVLHASGHELKFGHSSGLSWRLRTDGAGPGVLVIAVSERDGRKTLGRWTPSNLGAAGMPPSPTSVSSNPSGETSWHFVTKGEVLATLHGNRVDIAPAAAEISRKGYLGRLRFEEAIVLSSVFIENMHIFGRPPQVEPERVMYDEPVPSSCSILPPPMSPSPIFASKKLEHRASTPVTIPRSSSELERLSKLGSSILRRGRTLLLRKSTSMDNQKTIIA
ncbi:hypothetical protein V1520DRAFT_110377 [Lipomyces starkeyi]|uniref:Uncharacterized protein n=1 Tax=Lipomyces starkeyi NRRL Y-11557 TaxID=675824 RepID=A0A1E3Q7J0_LIPST|nr:hypothetical protein LIPSTDRAFT_265004 [Lipomyces starkeyi NRRL Y-11557]